MELSPEEIRDPFPEDITSEIAARLPAKSVLRLGSLWKAMRDLPQNPLLVDKHLQFSSRRDPSLILTDAMCRGKGNSLNTLYFVQNEETPNKYSCHRLNLKIPKFQEFRVMGSCNGLICLVHPSKRYEICICNPLTGEYINIPPPVSMEDIPGHIVIGFGVAPMTNKYKVIAIIDFLEPDNFITLQQKVFVYTLGDNSYSWRFKDNTSILRLGQSACKAFLNGALHWVSNSRQIVSFNMETEELDIIPRPQLELGSGRLCLRTFKGKLVMLNKFADRIEIWVMNNYRVAESWTHDFTVSEQQIGRKIRDIEIVCFLEDWEILMVHDDRALLRYNLQTASVSELRGVDGLPNLFDAVAHVGTLVSPLLGGDVEK